jgi:V8-like Glu-specific endopeptidase
MHACRYSRLLIPATMAALLCPALLRAQSLAGEVRSISSAPANGAKVDFAKAAARELPVNGKYSTEALKKDMIAALEKKGSLDGIEAIVNSARPGDGQRSVAKVASSAPKSKPRLEDFGTANLPYSTARADLDPSATNQQWPYRAAGKLFFLDGSDTYVCTASMIDRGLVVTAAHCAAEYGTKKYFAGWSFIPGYRKGEAPFGIWKVAKAYVLAAYPDGTAPCEDGVVCRDDIAVLALEPQTKANKKRYAGDATGWFTYVAGAKPFTSTGLVHVTQIGYPVCLDDGNLMERNDSQGAISSSSHDNTVIGSLMCGGSSGGPWVSNFGVKSDLTDTVDGVAATPNLMVGVTSWGATDKRVKQQGASPFLASNIGFLVKAACKDYPEACTR